MLTTWAESYDNESKLKAHLESKSEQTRQNCFDFMKRFAYLSLVVKKVRADQARAVKGRVLEVLLENMKSEKRLKKIGGEIEGRHQVRLAENVILGLKYQV